MQLVIVILGIALILYLIAYKNWDAFVTLLGLALILGLLLGETSTQVVASVEKGVGSILGNLALILGLGAMIAQLMEESGAAQVLAMTLIRHAGKKKIQWAVVLAGMIVSFALFFDTAFILLVPLIIAVAKQLKVSVLWIGMPAAFSLLAVHALFPPHPGPVAIAAGLHVNLGLEILLGLVVAGAAVVVGGICYTRIFYRYSKRVVSRDTADHAAENLPAAGHWGQVSFGASLTVMLMPIVLIALSSAVQIFKLKGRIASCLLFIGSPVVALLLTLFAAAYLLGVRQGKSFDYLMQHFIDSAKMVAAVILINGAGGGLKQVLVDTGTTTYLAHLMAGVSLPPLIAGFLVAALMRIVLGSATIAAITALSIVKPLLVGTPVSPELVMLAIGAGSMACSQVNDPGFWLFKQYFNVDVRTTFKTWTAMTTIGACAALAVVLAMSCFIK